MIIHNQRQGIFWSAVDKFSVQGVQFVLSLILARFLNPSDYGLVAMLTIFIAVSQTFIDSGFGIALIQKQDRTEKDFSTVFFFNLTLAIFFYVVLFFLSPLIASFYREYQLEIIIKVSALNLIVLSLSLVQAVRLRIAVDFKTLSKVSLVSALVGGIVGVVLANYGYGVWALVYQTLVSNILKTILLWYVSNWRPLLIFSKKSFLLLFSFGYKMLFSNILHTVYLNLYTLVIGKVYSPSNVGLYNRASHLSQYPSTNVTNIISNVYITVLCNAQHDDRKFLDVFAKYTRLTLFIVTPLAFGISALSEPFIRVVLTDKWMGMNWPLKILAWAYSIYPLMSMNCQPLMAKGRSDLFLKAEIIKKFVAIIVMLCALPFGLNILCLSILLYNLIDVCVIIFFAKYVMETGYKKQFIEYMPIVFAGIIMQVIIESFCNSVKIPNLERLVLGVVLGLFSYYLIAKCLKVKEIVYFENFFNRKYNGKL